MPAYEEELQSLVLTATGCNRAVVFDHTLRSDSKDIRGLRFIREPAHFIHNDYTDRSATKRFNEWLLKEGMEDLAVNRFAIVNVWRTIRNTVSKSPIACCDASTVKPGDLVSAERRAEHSVGELEFVKWNPQHRWYYYPGMTFSEALLIKTFDSREYGVARRCIHSSFENPLAEHNDPPRESIESRLLVMF